MSDYITVPIGKRCILVLTREEWQRGIQRGKAKRRAEALAKRTATQRGDKSRTHQ